MKKIVIALVVAALSLPCVLNAQKQGPDTPDKVKIKPDIVIHSLSAVKIADNPDGSDKVKITVTLKNACTVNSCVGPFKVLLEWTQDPTAGFHYLAEGGVAKLCYSKLLAVQKMVTLTFEDTVPAQQFRKYRLTADHLNQVDERDEGNNIGSTGYINR